MRRQPLLLDEDDVDFVDLVNSAGDLEALLLDVEADPDEYRLAEVAVEYFCTRYGIQRHGKGDRLNSLISVYRRYLVPFLVELHASRPAGRRGVADFKITHLETPPRVLASGRWRRAVRSQDLSEETVGNPRRTRVRGGSRRRVAATSPVVV